MAVWLKRLIVSKDKGARHVDVRSAFDVSRDRWMPTAFSTADYEGSIYEGTGGHPSTSS
jgi:hypothetical protein